MTRPRVGHQLRAAVAVARAVGLLVDLGAAAVADAEWAAGGSSEEREREERVNL